MNFLCLLGHKWKEVIDENSPCAFLITCQRCREHRTEIRHQWSDQGQTGDHPCDRMMVCGNCSESKVERIHDWGELEKLPSNFQENTSRWQGGEISDHQYRITTRHEDSWFRKCKREGCDKTKWI